ncbi:hypothetical protein EAG_01116 [Camponotus floridanus]|uniref:Uncharacterized protein n=1 Tax=Camponotus floridanus TaxID=104421 RepID=E2ABA0_CAMFO|nr:hypothetical protein EAG_01116 [Camponotus floridanus]
MGAESCGEPGIIGMSGPRDMNQAEQTLNLEIRCRRTKATYRGQRGEQASNGYFSNDRCCRKIDMLVDFMRYFTTHFPIHCHIHQRETKLKFVGKKEDTAHRAGEREREREREGGKQRNCKENKRRKRESLCELAHNGNAKVNSLPGRKSTVGHLGNRMCILNVSQGLYNEDDEQDEGDDNDEDQENFIQNSVVERTSATYAVGLRDEKSLVYASKRRIKTLMPRRHPLIGGLELAESEDVIARWYVPEVAELTSNTQTQFTRVIA